MKIEISALFGMKYVDKPGLDIHIGDGIFIQEILSNRVIYDLFQEVKTNEVRNYDQLNFREENENSGRYSHRFFVSFEGDSSLDDETFKKVWQAIARAIVLSRIVKPLSIPLMPTLIISKDGVAEAVIKFGFYSTAYIRIPAYRETFSEEDAHRMCALWPGSQYIYEHRLEYPRIQRALLTFNDAYHIDPNQLAHVVLHAALEALICTAKTQNRKQITKRLPQIVDGISEKQAIDIYEYNCGVKHDAEPTLLSSPNVFALHPDDVRRVEAARLLDEALRSILMRAMEDRSFADLLENKKELELAYPV